MANNSPARSCTCDSRHLHRFGHKRRCPMYSRLPKKERRAAKHERALGWLVPRSAPVRQKPGRNAPQITAGLPKRHAVARTPARASRFQLLDRTWYKARPEKSKRRDKRGQAKPR